MRIRECREGRGISQSELASLSGVSQAMISEAERGDKQLTVPKALAIANALKVTLDELINGQEEHTA